MHERVLDFVIREIAAGRELSLTGLAPANSWAGLTGDQVRARVFTLLWKEATGACAAPTLLPVPFVERRRKV